MIIEKKYKAYMAHRNQHLAGTKCARVHGHHYQITAAFELQRLKDSSITVLFDDFDKVIEPLLKDHFDHRMLLDINDPLAMYFEKYLAETGENLGPIILPFPTSVENVCAFLFYIIGSKLPSLIRLSIQETVSSTIIYTNQDLDYDIKHGVFATMSDAQRDTLNSFFKIWKA